MLERYGTYMVVPVCLSFLTYGKDGATIWMYDVRTSMSQQVTSKVGRDVSISNSSRFKNMRTMIFYQRVM